MYRCVVSLEVTSSFLLSKNKLNEYLNYAQVFTTILQHLPWNVHNHTRRKVCDVHQFAGRFAAQHHGKLFKGVRSGLVVRFVFAKVGPQLACFLNGHFGIAHNLIRIPRTIQLEHSDLFISFGTHQFCGIDEHMNGFFALLL